MTDHKTVANRYIDLWNERTHEPSARDSGRELDQRCEIRRSPDERRRP